MRLLIDRRSCRNIAKKTASFQKVFPNATSSSESGKDKESSNLNLSFLVSWNFLL